ncbi:MAG: MBL fold metallo-hydrolase [Betaproteobacteria bacterium]|nr:MBL fold metallo-hydrolase [Betaproteobacteria bacterium]
MRLLTVLVLEWALIQPVAAHAGFELHRIADGVHVAVRSEPAGLMVDANATLIINDQDVVVVDANVGPTSAKATLAALRKLTAKPVRYVINTHWHDDHVLGNQVWRDAFPGVEFIAHRTLADYLPGQGLKNRQAMLSGAPSGVAMLKSLLDRAQGGDGQPLSATARASHESDIRLVERYLAETPKVEIVGPTLTFEDRLVLQRGARRIEVLHLGRGHTAGDIVVHLPADGIVITGDLVVAPVPLIGRDQSHIAGWAVTLEKVLALLPKFIVPGHGPVFRDSEYSQRVIALLRDIQSQATAAKARGESLDAARKVITLADHRRIFAGDDQVRNMLFTQYVLGPGIGAVYRDR